MRPLVIIAVVLAAALWLLAGGSDARPDRSVQVTLAEWTLSAGRATVPAGAVTFDTRNAGRLEHELQIIRTDLPPDELPIGLEGVHYQGAGELVLGKPHTHEDMDRGLLSGHIRPGGSRRDTVRLEPGRYVLLCNLPGHYAAGQRSGLTVTAPSTS